MMGMHQLSPEQVSATLQVILVEERQKTQQLLDDLLDKRQTQLQKKLEDALMRFSGNTSSCSYPSEASYDITHSSCPVDACSKQLVGKATQRHAESPYSQTVTQLQTRNAVGVTASLRELQVEIMQNKSRHHLVNFIGAIVSSAHFSHQRFWELIITNHLPVWMSSWARRIVYNSNFNCFIGLAILANAIISAISTEMHMHEALSVWQSLPDGEIFDGSSYDAHAWVDVANIIFATLFFIELLCRVIADEFMFVFGDRAKWNLFDSCLVLVAWVDILVRHLGSSATHNADNYGFIRVVWSLRVARSLRIVRVLYLFKELRVVFLSLAGSVIHLFWAVLCLCVIIFVFMIIFMQGLADFVMSQKGGSPLVEKNVIPNFRSFGRTFCSLLMAITGGEDWGVYLRVLEEVSVGYSVLFVLYMMLMVFGVLNVITGIFCENAMAQARADFEVARGEEMRRSDKTAKMLARLFRELDAEMTGMISYDQWVKFVAQAEVRACFKMLHIDISRSADVFRLLDLDGSNYLDIDEFVSGCLHIQGGASSVDVEMLVRTTKTMLRKFKGYSQKVEEAFCQEHRTLTRMMQEFLDAFNNNIAPRMHPDLARL